MPKLSRKTSGAAGTLPKCPTGITGLDQITGGGLPKGRTTLVCGGTGCGKTLLGLEFLVRGALEFDEAGVFVSFEERAEDLVANTASLGFDLPALLASEKVLLEHIEVASGDALVETGDYSLDGLFIRLGAAIDAVGAKRIVLDTIEVLFGAFANQGILRGELQRLFGWLKDRGVTAVVGAEQGDGTLTRHGLEEYVSDCVILLDQRVHDEIATRRLRMVKYRGSAHGANEYPFIIGAHGLVVMPITAISLSYEATKGFVSSGVPKLDAMLGGKGFYRGSTAMISGRAGTGKTSLSARFVEAACQRGERSLYCALEESPSQIIRNMSSIGIDLQPWAKRGLLKFVANRPSSYGLEVHINLLLEQIEQFQPQVVVVDPVSSLTAAGGKLEVQRMLMRMIDMLKAKQITAMFTTLTPSADEREETVVGISSLVDTWLLVRDLEQAGERTRGLYIIKARGMAHSKQIRELLLTDDGIDLADIYLGPDGVVVGSARAAQLAQDEADAMASQQKLQRKKVQLQERGRALQARIEALQAEFTAESQEIEADIEQEDVRQRAREAQRAGEAMARQGGSGAAKPEGGRRASRKKAKS